MPLTSFEIWRWQVDKNGRKATFSLLSVRQEVKALQQKGALKEFNGFYALKDALQPSPSDRPSRLIYTALKWRVLRRKSFFLPYIPYLRYARVIGSVALANAKRKSDLDISIGSARGFLWSVRLSVLFIALVFGFRRNEKKYSDRLCFNHNLGESNIQEQERVAVKTLFHINEQSLILWEKGNKNTAPLVKGPVRLLELLKYSTEKLFLFIKIAPFFEKIAARIQIKHINKRRLYSSKLPPLSIYSKHLIFSSQKVEAAEKKLQDNLRSFL